MLHVFDLDGTLLPGTSASLEVARNVGCLPALTALEARFAAGELDTVGFATEIHRIWRGLTASVVTAAFGGSPWLAGIDEVCADIRRRGERSAVITMSPDFFAAGLLDLGFDEVVASRFPPLPLAAPVDPAGILTPADKVRVTDELRARYGVPLSRCVAYGDSRSDAPLFRHLRATVAVNADAHLAGIAAASYRGGDLRAVYAIGRALVDGAAVDGAAAR